MKESSRDLIGGAAASVIGSAYLLLASQVRSSALDDTLGPGGMPKAYGWAMLVLGVSLFASALWRQRHPSGITNAHQRNRQSSETNAEQQRSNVDAPSVSHQITRASGMLLLGIIYVLLIDTLGYFISIALLIIGVALYMGERQSFRVLLVGLLGALGMWTMFVQLLGVAMPAGIFDFL